MRYEVFYEAYWSLFGFRILNADGQVCARERIAWTNRDEAEAAARLALAQSHAQV